MSHKNSLLFIGGVDKGHTPTNGETMKNQLYLDRFEEFFDIIHVIDTHNWKHRPWVFLQIPLYVLSFPHAKIFLSINRGLSLCRLLYYIGQSKRTYCSVVGGNLLEVLEKKQNYLPSIQNLRGIFVQGRKMAETLKNQYRIPNAVYVPNAKPYYAITPATCAPAASVLQFVFLSRLHPDKGIDLILRCAERLDREGFGNKFRIDFYGKPATSDYEQEFRKRIETLENVSYSGVLNLKEEAGYRTLCRYDMMLFPTYWYGEGFPGIVIDAYIAGVPLIASDWNMNTEVITEKTGVIIPPKDEEALYIAMKNCIFPDISSRKSDYSTDYDMLKENLKIWLRGVSFLLLFILWGGELFRLKRSYLRKKNRLKSFIYYSCLSGYGSWIGIESKIEDVPVFPHGMYGIFVSDGAEIGKNAVIFQQVTIGSNTLADSRKQGSPVIGDNVYIGSGAKIIGNIRIGNNVRIGANCIVVEDIEDNSVVVMNKPRIIKKTHSQNNTFITRGELKSQDRHDNH